MKQENQPKDDTEITDNLDPAEKDARWLRRWYPLSLVSKIAFIVFSLIFLTIIGGYYTIGTHWGTQRLLQAISQQTGIQLKVGNGNLRDGLWIYDLLIADTEKTNFTKVTVDKAFVKIGWRALISKEVHLRQAVVGDVVVQFNKPSENSDEPFDYPTIALPFNLRLDDTVANLVRYQHRDELTLDFKRADIQDFTWQHAKLTVGKGKLDYGDLFSLTNVTGYIDLQKDYPVQADADITIHSLTDVYFDDIQAKFTGSLKSAQATVTTYYNKGKVTGTLTAQPLEKNVPFTANLAWQDLKLPYAVSQNIHLKQGVGKASGTIDDIQLDIDTKLTANDIPDGRYRGQANVNTKQLTIKKLVASLPQGEITTTGDINWEDRAKLILSNKTENFDVKPLLPKDIAPYLPNKINGKLDFNLWVSTDEQPLKIQTKLQQSNGEIVNATISQMQGDNQPYHIDTDWQNFNRQNIPNIGEIISTSGKASIKYQPADNKQSDNLQVRLHSDIDKLNIAPKGNYQIKLNKIAEKITIQDFVYQGIAGQLSGNGNLQLAHKKQPLTWQLDVNANQFLLNNVLDNVPLQNLTGKLSANGHLQNLKQNKTLAIDRHAIQIHNVDMTADLIGEKDSKKSLKLLGNGKVQVDLANNDLHHLTAKFDGNLNAQDMPNGKLLLDISGNTKQLSINNFSHQGETGGISAKGKVDLTQGVAWQIDANMKQFDASFFAPNLPSRLTGDIITDGFWRDTQQWIHIQKMDIAGLLKNQNLTAKGKLTAKFHLPKDLSTVNHLFTEQKFDKARTLIDQLQADDVVLTWGKNRLTATGNQQQLVTSVDVSTLNQLVENLRGTIKGGIVLKQSSGQNLPDIYVDLTGQGMSMPNFTALDVKATGKLMNLAKLPSQLQVSATGLNIANQTLRDISLNFNGTQNQHLLDFKIESSRGNLQASLKGAIDLQKQQWQGVLGNGQIGTKFAKLQQIQPTQMLVNWQKFNVELANHCWQMAGQKGKLCLKENLKISDNLGKINVNVQQIDSQIFAVVLPKDIAWSGNLNGNALINWQKNQKPTVNASFYSDNGVVGTAPQTPDEIATTIAYDRVSVIARTVQEGLKLRADVKTSQGSGNGYLDATINPYQSNKPINGTLVFEDINLAVLKPFFPAFEQFSGTGLVAGKIGGTLNKPNFVGDIEIQQGVLSVLGLPMKFADLEILTHVEGNQAKVTGTFNTAGDGKGMITGTADWTKEFQVKLKVQGDKLLLNQPPLVSADVNPEFDILVKPLQRYVNVVGVIDIPRAVIRPPEASENVVVKSSDVNVIDRRLAGQIDDVLKVSQPWHINAEIGIDLGANISFQGFGAKLPLAGALHLTQQGQSSLKSQGVVQVAKRSKADIFGQSLNINFAQIRFNGAISDPNLNIEAVKEIQGVTVGVQVRGKTSKPDIMVFNNGGLTEQQAKNALVTGSLNNTSENTSNQEFVSRVNNTLAAAGLSLGLSGTRGLTNEIGRAFGLQSLTLDATGSSNDTEVSLTGYITPDLYIRYGVGVFNADHALSMRYQLTRRLYIEARSAVNNSVDLIYNWRF